mmetsp:Transcript_81468/g.132060  ORF Transcript_81468/g.132060 Transcript_81468/m.132060 type:complete len:149 (+) Transcript_81468:3-449(+)
MIAVSLQRKCLCGCGCGYGWLSFLCRYLRFQHTWRSLLFCRNVSLFVTDCLSLCLQVHLSPWICVSETLSEISLRLEVQAQSQRLCLWLCLLLESAVCVCSRACVFVFVYVSCSFALCIYTHIASIQSHTNLLSGNSIKKRDRRGEGG